MRFFYNPMLVDQSSRVVFTLLTLEQNGLSFVITDKINHSEQASANCTTLAGSSQMICSDTMILDEDSIFSLPVDNFAFGIVSSSLYAMRFFELPEFRVEHYRFDHESPFPNGVSNFTLNGSIRNDRALRLVEFGIGILPPLPSPPLPSPPLPSPPLPSPPLPSPPLPSPPLPSPPLPSPPPPPAYWYSSVS